MVLSKYKTNLRVIGDNVISYTTHVATIDHSRRKVYIHGYWSTTTTKHINYVIKQLGYLGTELSKDELE
jgi:hypothetical protein